MNLVYYFFNKQKLLDNNLHDLFLNLFAGKVHPEVFNNVETYMVSWDKSNELRCSEKILKRFMFSEDVFDLFTLEELIGFGDANKNIGIVDEAAFKKFSTNCLQHVISHE